MAQNETPEEELYEDIYTLTDEDGNELEFRLIGTHETDAGSYYAMVEIDTEGNDKSDEYVVLRAEKDENGDEMLVTIDDDDEFDREADYFDDLFSDIDYDEPAGN